MWPTQPANFREVALEYYELMKQITEGVQEPMVYNILYLTW